MSLSLPPAWRRFLSRVNRHPFWRTWRTVWGNRLCVPTADRLLYVTLHQLGLMGAGDRRFYESALRPGMTVLDIGANIGLFTQLFARLVGPTGKVYAFEPDPELAAAVESSAASRGAASITVFPCGLGEANEDRWLQRAALNSGDNRVAADLTGDAGHRDATRISLRRGDELLPAPMTADFIKIDVQGWELHALRGLRELIGRSPGLQVYLEFWPQGLRAAGTEPGELFDFLRELGMDILREQADGTWAPAETVAAVQGPLGEWQFVNLRAVKKH